MEKVILNNFYVYIYCGPRRNEGYRYGDLEFEYEPFYAGKGLENRITPKNHQGCNKYMVNTLYKIGIEHIVILVPINKVQESVANMYEKRYIQEIGRRDLGLGPLLNMTDGGEGAVGRIFSEEHRKKLSIANSGHVPSREDRKKMSQAQKKRFQNPEQIKILSERAKGRTPWNKGIAVKCRTEPLSKESIKKISIANSGCNNGMAILDEEQVNNIKKLYQQGYSNKYIAHITKFKYGLIYGITSGRTYKNIQINEI